MGGEFTRALCLIVFLSIVVIGKGDSSFNPRCAKETITVVQTPTGRIAGCTKEWKVNVTNTCECYLFGVHLQCPKFDAIVLTNDDHYTISENGELKGDCVLNKGESLGFSSDQHHNVFTYVGDRIDFVVSTYSEACS
ncbi:hypothetical protein ABFX02_02G061000 [Erythranthe guttata]|uniref:uncharacterized protein LOC105949521 n=1 Tax=Erythranthe guttata TaxID=4155 RepID=UPI00064DF44F|nr:PREDICTED: uncharacterized protein LOC105949521 [Erythranthe guttata]|eukprot:XP_012828277.1 PREDICTED: uncharacterized protein LOC105949521 [Erythranthe guttata]